MKLVFKVIVYDDTTYELLAFVSLYAYVFVATSNAFVLFSSNVVNFVSFVIAGNSNLYKTFLSRGEKRS